MLFQNHLVLSGKKSHKNRMTILEGFIVEISGFVKF